MMASWAKSCLALMVTMALAAVLGTVFLFSRTAPSKPNFGRVVTIAGPTMGTRYTVRYIEGKEFTFEGENLQNRLNDRLAEINRKMSTYDPNSELSRFNASGADDWFKVSEETRLVIDYALAISERTDGAFDPTVGPAVNLWGFGPDGRRKEPPSDAEIADVRRRIGYGKIETQESPWAIRKSEDEIYLDLSAIAKGYAVDALGELLNKSGIVAYMVEIGGEVVVQGRKPGDSPWRIGVEKPDARGRSVRTVIEMTEGALATSGDYRNFFEVGGRRYSHAIDPTTARPATHAMATATVWAATCMEADALATALIVMGPKKGYDWTSREGVAATWIERTPDGFRARSSPAWAKRFDAPQKANP